MATNDVSASQIDNNNLSNNQNH
ncbi:unnamed protein product, partial [Rotaria sp. Silwood1]